MIAKAALIAALAASFFAALQTVRVDRLRDLVTTAEAQRDQCRSTLTAYLEGEEIDNAIPDDLDGVTVRPEWLLPPGATAP